MLDPIIEKERQDYNQPGPTGPSDRPFDKQQAVYRRVDGRDLEATLYRPTNWRDRPAPAIVFVHGGGWSAGDRGQFARHCAFMATNHGIAGLCISYRLTTQAPYPACVQDARAAVRWLQARGADYGIQPDRIAIGGSSSGAHIAAMVMTNADLISDMEAVDLLPLRLAAAVLYNGVFRLPVDPPDELTVESTTMLLGGRADEVPDRYRAASPLNYVSADCPATLLLHGSADRIISHRQSLEFADRLKAVGVPAEVELFDGADHGALNDPTNLPRSLGRTAEFLKRHLWSSAARHYIL